MEIKRIKKPLLDAIINTGLTVFIFSVCTGLCFLLDYFKINDLNFLIIYVLGILLTAFFTKGYVFSSVLSIISVLGYNYFFTVPRFTLKIDDEMYLVTFFLMVAVGLGISFVTFQLKKKMAQVSALSVEKIKLKNDADKEMLKATLLRSVSHDLRTPLTTIKNGAEIMLENPKLDAEDKTAILRDIVSKADWTVRLVENLLALTRIDSKKLEVKKTAEAIEEVVPQAVRSVSGALGGRSVHYEIPEELMLVPMDATLMMQVVGNLLTNAAKHTDEDGNIWIKVWNTGKNVIFRISNDGDPMREEDIPHIFEMYYTVGDGRGEGGIGLGLSICKLIIAAHGGQISARNADGKVVFEFNLPTEEIHG